MSCPGVHCACCAGGIAVPVVPLLEVCGLAWVAEHLIEVAVVSAGCGIASLAAVVALMRWAGHRDAQRAVEWRSPFTREIPATLTATVIPQAVAGERPAIEHHHHGPVFNFYGEGSREAARVIRTAIPGDSGARIITEEQ